MLEVAQHSDRPIHFIHCARNGAVHAFRDWVENIAAQRQNFRHFVCCEPSQSDRADATGFLTLERLSGWLPAERDLDAYFLGPKPFMAQVKKHLKTLGVPDGQCHYEFFGPASALDS